MSFNAPFTTMSYYSWLFDNDGQNGEAGARGQSSASTVQDPFSGSLDPNMLAASNTVQHDEAFLLADMRIQMELEASRGNVPYLITDGRSTDFSREHDSADDRSTRVMDEVLNTGNTPYPFSSAQSVGHDATSTDFETTSNPSLNSSSRGQNMSFTANTSVSRISTPLEQRSASLCLHPSPDTYVPRNTANLPLITNEARDGLMQLINQSRPTKPDGSEIVSTDPLLSLSSLQHYSDLFFTRFNSSYPLIHQATFRSDEVHTYLLMAILLLGATYSDKEAHLLAVCVHDIMRPLIHGSKDFGIRPNLWMLQTILLVECFGKSRAGEKQHDMSHLSHGMLIK
jgi:hypothetical protein